MLFVTGKPVVTVFGWAFELHDSRYKLMGDIGSGHSRIPKGEFIIAIAEKHPTLPNVFETDNTVYRLQEAPWAG